MSNRPTFQLDNQPIRAGGALFYTTANNTFYILMAFTNNYFADLGGKTDQGDESIYDTVAREVCEETNGIFKENIVKYQVENSPYIYFPASKYALFLVEANAFERNCHVSRFGTKETNKKERTLTWIPVHSLLHNPVHSRIHKHSVLNFFGIK